MKQGKKQFGKAWWALVVLLLFRCGPADTERPDSDHQPILQDSLGLLTSQIAAHPRNTDFRLQRAQIFYQRKAFDAALKDIGAAIRMDSTVLTTYLFKSQVELDYYRSLDALRTLSTAESKWPESALVKEKMSETHLILKQYKSAREKASEALTLSPFAARPYLILGMVARESKDTVAAIQYLKEAVQNDADLLDAWIELAHLQMERDPEDALTYFESALQIAPEDLRLLHTYAIYWQQQDSLKTSKIIYDRMIDLDSNYQESYFNKALILMDQDSFQRALPLWDAFLRKTDQPAKGYYYRGISYEMSGNRQQALSDYRQAQELNPNLESINRAIESLIKSTE